MNVALYCRVSTEDQKKYGLSIDTQKDALIQYCKDNKYTYDIYCDEGISASSMKRPALIDMLNKIDKYKMVLFTKLDRLSRNVLDANVINNKLKEHNCSIKAIFEDDVDTSTADGKFIFDLKISLAERELGKTSERIKSVFDYKVRVLKTVISGSKKYGYDIINKKYVVNEEEAEIMRNIFKFFLNCGSLRKTFFEWNKITNKVSYYNFKSMLKNKNYIGIFDYHGEEILDYIPRIMDDNLFYKVQDTIKKNRKVFKKKDNKYIFTGMLRCGKCGLILCAMTNSTNHNHKYYRCSSFIHAKGCSHNNYYREDILEKDILNQLPILIEKYELEQKANASKPIIDNTPKIKEKIKRLQELYIDGSIEKKLFNEKYNELNNKLVEQTEMLKNSNSNQSKVISKFIKGNYLDMYNKLDIEHKATFFRNIIDKIELYEDRTFKITFKVY